MGNIPAHMQSRTDWRLGRLRKRSISIRTIIGWAIGLSALVALVVLALHP
jgi:hypothetical protein